jgi:hypothetical protein
MHNLPGALRVSQVLGVSLDTCHALRGPRQTFEHSPCRTLRMGFWAVKTIAICFAMPGIATLISGLYQASGSAVFPVAYVVPCVRFNCIVRFSPPLQLQHSI